MARQFERSPRQRTEWFGSTISFDLNTSTVNGGFESASRILTSNPRLTPSTGSIFPVGFPAGIVRGETCSIARMIAHVSVYDRDRRQQNASHAVGMGFIKQEVEDDAIADPVGVGTIVSAPDALQDRRASWIGHWQTMWNPQSAGANYTVLEVHHDFDTTNSRIFESNEVLQLSVEVQSLLNSGQSLESLNLRIVCLWRCLLRLD